MTTKNCANGPKLVRKVFCAKFPVFILLLCISHMLQQLWRVRTESAKLYLNLFKKSLYAKTNQDFENCFTIARDTQI